MIDYNADIISKEAIPAVIVTFITYLGFGVVLTLIPDWSETLGIVNKGFFFVVFTVSSVFIRVLAGKISDIYGRKLVILISLLSYQI